MISICKVFINVSQTQKIVDTVIIVVEKAVGNLQFIAHCFLFLRRP